ncbi:MAG: ATP synthase F0 subunit B [Actinomycetes bacterium]
MLGLLAALAAEVPEKVINPVVPDEIGEIFWGAVGFFSLWILLRYLCLPPLLKIRAERDQQVLADQEAAAAAETQGEQVRRDYEATLAEARAEANRVVELARVASEAERSAVVQVAEDAATAQRTEAMAELDVARASALNEIRGDVAALAITAASKVVQSDLDLAQNQSTIDDYVNQASGNR